MRKVDYEIAALAREQHGLVSRRQLMTLGLSAGVIEYRLRAGSLIWEATGRYSVPSSPSTPRRDLLAAILDGASRTVASHRSAAALLSFRGFPLRELEVATLSKTGLRCSPRGVIRHRTDHLLDEEVTIADGIPVTAPARTLLDLGLVLTANSVEWAVHNAVQDRLVTEPELLDCLACCGKNGRPGTASLRRALTQATVSTDSGLEEAALACLMAAGFDEPIRQFRVVEGGRFLGRVDFAYPGLKIAIEADGWDFHSSRPRFMDDRRRQNQLVAAGWAPIRFTSADRPRPRSFLEALNDLIVTRKTSFCGA